MAILSKAVRIKTEANVTVRVDETSYVYIPVRHKPTSWEVMTVTEVSTVTAQGQCTKRGPHSADLAGMGAASPAPGRRLPVSLNRLMAAEPAPPALVR